MKSRSRIPAGVLVAAATLLATVGAWWLAESWRATPPPALHESDFRMERGAEHAYEIRPGHPLVVPFPFSDFDLFAEIELADDTDLDLVVRHVEPVLREEGMPLFHARYASVRSSTRAEGDPVRSREAALFDRPEDGGVKLGAGRVATVQLEARGRVVSGNVAGVPIPEFSTTDAHGGVAVVAPRGFGLVQTLVIRNVPRPRVLLPIGWALIGGAILAVGLVALRGTTRRAVAALLVVPAVAWIGGALVLRHVLPECDPETSSVVLITLAGAPAALALARLRSLWIALVVGAASIFGALEFAARIETCRLAPFEDPRLTAHFGWGSASMPFDVLVPRLRARAEVHVPESATNRAAFLGGGMLYEGGVDREDWIGPIAAFAARRELGEPVSGVVLPTLYSCAAQQLALFRRFCVEPFAPRAVVFAIPPWEGEASDPLSPRQVLAGEFSPPTVGSSALLSLWLASRAESVPTTDAEGLVGTLREVDELARARGLEVLFVSAEGLRADLRDVVASIADECGREHAVIDFDDDVQGAVDELASWLGRALAE